MEKNTLQRRINRVLLSFEVGFFLAVRQIRRGALWTNILIVSIMVFTFLNLVVVGGILVGLIEGAVQGVEEHYTGDIIISNLKNHSYIEQSNTVRTIIASTPGVIASTARYLEGGTIEENYKSLPPSGERREVVSTTIAGINPQAENSVTNLESLIVRGEFLDLDDTDEVLLGALLLSEFVGFESELFPVLNNTNVGSKVLVRIHGVTREVTVKGILRSKVDEVDRRVFFTDSHFRKIIGRYDYNVDEISIKLAPKASASTTKNMLLASGIGTYAKVQTREDAEPKFIKDLKNTFAILGNVISSIGLIVATITIFIVIFINAITRRKYIGILKGIGVEGRALEIAYVLQALFYAAIGTIVGVIIVFGFLQPYIAEHPINFPFSDGILVATPIGTLLRIAVLFLATAIAGYIPAFIVVRQNTLDAILNR